MTGTQPLEATTDGFALASDSNGFLQLRIMERRSGWPSCEEHGLAVGDHWAYRLKTSDYAVARVVVHRLGKNRPARAQVQFVDDEFEGKTMWVPPVRLVAKWTDVEPWISREARWAEARRMSTPARHTVEAIAVYEACVAIDPRTTELKFDEARDAVLSVDLNWCANYVDVSEFESVDGSFRDEQRLVLPWPAVTPFIRALVPHFEPTVIEQLRDEDSFYRLPAARATGDVLFRGPRGVGRTYQQLAQAHLDACALVRTWLSEEAAITEERLDAMAVLQGELQRLELVVVRLLRTLADCAEPSPNAKRLNEAWPASFHSPITRRTVKSIADQLDVPLYQLRAARPYRWQAAEARSK